MRVTPVCPVLESEDLMRFPSASFAASVLLVGFSLALAGCTQSSSKATTAAPVPVKVSYPVEREVTDHADFTARTEAVDSVELRARVSGYLDSVNFKEGALVNKG